MTNSDDQTLIERLITGRLRHRPLGSVAARDEPVDLDAGYDAQDALNHRLVADLGDIGGYKIGCTTPVMQSYLGIPHPCAGVVFSHTLHHDPTKMPFTDFVQPGVECEIAVRLAHDLPGRAAPHDRASVGSAVATCYASIEIVDNRYLDYPNLSTPTLVADNFFGAALVLGPPINRWQSLDLAAITGRLWIDGMLIGSGRGYLILGHPLDALAWLANHLVARGKALKEGDFVTLGSVVKTFWIERAGTEVRIEFDGLGEATVLFQ